MLLGLQKVNDSDKAFKPYVLINLQHHTFFRSQIVDKCLEVRLAHGLSVYMCSPLRIDLNPLLGSIMVCGRSSLCARQFNADLALRDERGDRQNQRENNQHDVDERDDIERFIFRYTDHGTSLLRRFELHCAESTLMRRCSPL